VLSASVVAPTAALADALATAFYVMGPQAMQAYCVSHREIGAVLTLPGRVSGKIEIQSANLSDEQLMNLDESGRSG
jgi:thiamine biosynthesis lipoprotein